MSKRGEESCGECLEGWETPKEGSCELFDFFFQHEVWTFRIKKKHQQSLLIIKFYFWICHLSSPDVRPVCHDREDAGTVKSISTA